MKGILRKIIKENNQYIWFIEERDGNYLPINKDQWIPVSMENKIVNYDYKLREQGSIIIEEGILPEYKDPVINEL